MSKSRNQPVRLLLLVAFSFCFISFQNCTLHQSEGRKFLDSMDPTVAVMGSCLPLLSATALASSFNNVTPEVTLANMDFLSAPDATGNRYFEESARGCLVYNSSPTSSGAGTMRCAIRSQPSFSAVAGQSLTPPSTFGWAGTTQWRSFGNPPTVTYRIEGQRTGVTNQWGVCDFTFTMPEASMPANEKADARLRGQTAIIQMLLNN